ncbi:MAG: NAD-glutamate dehydrogenase, partial [Phenylobacterium sp.]|nr:NAD-glutamate dehydrogenase [Phenylobacterium sp.]
GLGMTRPEEAVLLAYGKLELSHDIVASRAPDDPHFEAVLEGYFPKALRKYDDALRKHRLRREIIATVVANDVINRCGPSLPSRLMAAASCDLRAFVAGYEAAKAVLGLPAVWDAVAALDPEIPGQTPAAGQMALFRRLAFTLRGETFWLARRAGRTGASVGDLINRYGPGTATLRKLGPQVLSEVEQTRTAAQIAKLVEAGAPEALAAQVANLQPLTTAVDLVDLAEASSWALPNVARLYHQTGAVFAFDRLRAAAGGFTAGDAFERTAVRRLLEDLLAEQAVLTRSIMTFAASPQAGETPEAARKAIASWTALRRDAAEAAAKSIAEIEAAGGGWTFAKLTIANAALRELAASATTERKA